ncbi:MAG: hypothetical protein WED04_00455 [Promethearchaeati archaeon SRVP18_Atabeyarchaeia-1]
MISGRARAVLVSAVIVVVGMVCVSGLSLRPSSAGTPLVAEVVDEQGGFKLTTAL